MNPLNLVKIVTGLVVGYGTSTLVGNVVKASTPDTLHIVKRVAVGIGGYFLGSLVATKVTDHAIDEIDDTVEKIKTLKIKLKKIAVKAK